VIHCSFVGLELFYNSILKGLWCCDTPTSLFAWAPYLLLRF